MNAPNNQSICRALRQEWKITDTVHRNEWLPQDPECVDAWCDLGNDLIRADRWTQAAECFQKALELNPYVTDALFNLAFILQHLGDARSATVYYRKLIELDDNDVDAKLNLAKIFDEQRYFQESAKLYEEIIREHPNGTNGYQHWAISLAEQGQHEAAAERLLDGLKFGWMDPDLLNHLARMMLLTERENEASEILKRSWQAQPTNTQTALALGELALSNSDYSLALEWFDVAINQDHTCLMAHDLSALACFEQENWQQLLDHVQELVIHQSSFVSFYCQWAQKLSGKDALEETQIETARFLESLGYAVDSDEHRKRLSRVFLANSQLLSEYGAVEPALLYRQVANSVLSPSCSYNDSSKSHDDHQVLASSIGIDNTYLSKAIREVRCATNLMDSRNQKDDNTKSIQVVRVNLSDDQIGTLEFSQKHLTSCGGIHCRECWSALAKQFQPISLGPNAYRLSSDCRPSVVFDETFVASVPNGRAWVAPKTSSAAVCNELAVFSSEDELLKDLSRFYPWFLPSCPQDCRPDHPHLTGQPIPEPIRLKGRAAILSSLSGHNYYHWMIDILPRFKLLHEAGFSIDDVDHFVINNLGSFQRQSLELLGIPLNKIIESDRQPHIIADQLLLPSYCGHFGWPSDFAIRFLRELAPDTFPDKPTKFPERIFVGRSSASHRRMINQSDVMSVLRDHGFETVWPEDLTVADQIKLFSNAKMIVAAHGAALTNLAFCPKGTKVLELFPENYVPTYYWPISRKLELDHYYLIGKSIQGAFLRKLMYLNPLAEDFKIDVNTLRHVLSAMAFPDDEFRQKSSFFATRTT